MRPSSFHFISHFHLFKPLLFLSMVLFHLKVSAQVPKPVIGLTFSGVCENREYDGPRFERDETVFGFNIMPTASFKLDSNKSLVLGFNALKQFGEKRTFIDTLKPIAYYKNSTSKSDFYFGIFLRQGLLDNYPQALYNSLTNFYRPQVEGALLNFKGAKAHQNVWIDWDGLRSNNVRESFVVGTSGRYNVSPRVFIENYFLLHHNAFTFQNRNNEILIDNGAEILKLGVDINTKSFLDSATILTGAFVGINRARELTGINMPVGLISELFLQKKAIGTHFTFYIGEGQFLDFGSAFYKARQYYRTDIFYEFLKSNKISMKAIMSFHNTKNQFNNGNSLDTQQSLYLSIKL